MSDTRISAADLLRLVAIASVSPEGSSDEVVAILQRTVPAEPVTAETEIHGGSIQAESITAERLSAIDASQGDADADSDKLAKPE